MPCGVTGARFREEREAMSAKDSFEMSYVRIFVRLDRPWESDLLNYDDNASRILRLANNLVSNCKFVTPPRTLSFGSHCLTLPLTRLKFGWTWLLPGTFLLREICQKSFGQPPFLERNTLTVLEVALFFTQVQLKLFTFAVEYSKRGTEFNEAMRCCERWESSINDVRYILKQ